MHLELVEKILDPNKYDAVEVKKVIDIALLCTQEWATMRPTMFEVVVLLSSNYMSILDLQFLSLLSRISGPIEIFLVQPIPL